MRKLAAVFGLLFVSAVLYVLASPWCSTDR